eukprot:5919944-Prymnesium_polylepis.1
MSASSSAAVWRAVPQLSNIRDPTADIRAGEPVRAFGRVSLHEPVLCISRSQFTLRVDEGGDLVLHMTGQGRVLVVTSSGQSRNIKQQKTTKIGVGDFIHMLHHPTADDPNPEPSGIWKIERAVSSGSDSVPVAPSADASVAAAPTSSAARDGGTTPPPAPDANADNVGL